MSFRGRRLPLICPDRGFCNMFHICHSVQILYSARPNEGLAELAPAKAGFGMTCEGTSDCVIPREALAPHMPRPRNLQHVPHLPLSADSSLRSSKRRPHGACPGEAGVRNDVRGRHCMSSRARDLQHVSELPPVAESSLRVGMTFAIRRHPKISN